MASGFLDRAGRGADSCGSLLERHWSAPLGLGAAPAARRRRLLLRPGPDALPAGARRRQPGYPVLHLHEGHAAKHGHRRPGDVAQPGPRARPGPRGGRPRLARLWLPRLPRGDHVRRVRPAGGALGGLLVGARAVPRVLAGRRLEPVARDGGAGEAVLPPLLPGGARARVGLLARGGGGLRGGAPRARGGERLQLQLPHHVDMPHLHRLHGRRHGDTRRRGARRRPRGRREAHVRRGARHVRRARLGPRRGAPAARAGGGGALLARPRHPRALPRGPGPDGRHDGPDEPRRAPRARPHGHGPQQGRPRHRPRRLVGRAGPRGARRRLPLAPRPRRPLLRSRRRLRPPLRHARWHHPHHRLAPLRARGSAPLRGRQAAAASRAGRRGLRSPSRGRAQPPSRGGSCLSGPHARRADWPSPVVLRPRGAALERGRGRHRDSPPSSPPSPTAHTLSPLNRSPWDGDDRAKHWQGMAQHVQRKNGPRPSVST
mmetsp:Transcript_42419/g.100674  ORF Transcript_42419/g.100674 Transcript_42419/m.100674 type:complete len:487 (-) Transcript_42419:166-1626(-)